MALSAEIPEPYELAGVTYHGPEAHQEWVAFLVNNEEGRAGGPGGLGRYSVRGTVQPSITARRTPLGTGLPGGAPRGRR
jgi:hypothetical protein